jgi:2-oxoglutarate ferredoxin oxidoreductase subunit delta
MNHIEVNQNLCKGCGLCVDACPKDVLKLGDDINVKGYHYAVQYKEGCIACKMCAEMCPDVAITVFKAVKAKG